MSTSDKKPIISTGSREEWLAAADLLLNGIFKNIDFFEDPIEFPRHEFKVSYPNTKSKPREYQGQRFEGLARTFLLAAVRIHEDPNLSFNGFSVKEYYAYHILHACTKGDPLCVGLYSDLLKNENNPFAVFQQTVESGLLTIGLWACENEIWSAYTIEERNRIAAFLTEYAYGNTVHQNWRLFNLLMLAFLDSHGYPQDKTYIHTLATEVLLDYHGEGWYKDGQNVDYYSSWAYQFFLPLWVLWYGREHEKEIAAIVEENLDELMKHYDRLFDREGHMLMWGRSNIYRCAAVVPFISAMFMESKTIAPSTARKICSSVLAQFLNKPNLLINNVLSLGFYGEFPPLVQPYSCAESTAWMFMTFFCLLLNKDHPFWCEPAKESEWKTQSQGIRQTSLMGPKLFITNHYSSGSVILRTGNVDIPHQERELWNYSRLYFHSLFPWESTLCDGTMTAQYTILDAASNKKEFMNRIAFCSEQDSVLLREGLFNAASEKDKHWTNRILLADFPVEYGQFRMDMPQFLNREIVLRLGSLGFPYPVDDIQRFTSDDWTALVISGRDPQGSPVQMAMTVNEAWETIEVIESTGTSAVSETSHVITARCAYAKDGRDLPAPLISQVLTKQGEKPFSMDELFPVHRVMNTQPWRYTIQLKNGDEKTFKYEYADN